MYLDETSTIDLAQSWLINNEATDGAAAAAVSMVDRFMILAAESAPALLLALVPSARAANHPELDWLTVETESRTAYFQ